MTPTTSPISDIVTLISVVVVICFLRRLIGIFPSLLASLIRWKESVNLSNSVKLNRDRNMIALVMTVPFCLMVARSGMYSPSFLSSLGEDARFGIIFGIFVFMMILRYLLERMCAPKRRNTQTYRFAKESSYTFFILMTISMLILWGILSVIKTDAETAKDAMLWLSAVIYLIYILRKTQIFTSSCSIFTAFLYLCALEILPTGALVASALIF